MLDFNLEAMQAQIQSKLGKELDAIWQELIDFRDQKCQDMSYHGRFGAVKKFFIDKTAKKFIAAVWKNVGLHIRELHVTTLETTSFANASFFCPEDRDDQKGYVQIDEMLNGNYFHKCFPELYFGDGTINTDELIKIASSYDATKGVISSAVRMQMRSKVQCDIYFDVETAFLMMDNMPANSGIGNMTAQEITAVMLHEIGHTINLVEHAADMYARISTQKYLEAAFLNAGGNDINKTVELAEKVAEKVAAKGDKFNAGRILAITNKVKHDVKFAGSAARKEQVRGIIGSIICFCFTFMFDVIVIPLSMVFGNSQKHRFGVGEQKNKLGDIPLNGRMVSWNERKADEYAFSHGYGAFQVSALDKLNKYIVRRGRTAKDVATINQAEEVRKDIGFFAKMNLLIMAPMIASDYTYYLYPEGVKRFRELLNISIQQLKAHSTNPAYVTKYMKDIEFILSKMENYDRTEEYVAKICRGYDIFMKYASIPSFIDWIVHGRVQREIEELVNDVNGIGNNLLTFYGQKLQQIATK